MKVYIVKANGNIWGVYANKEAAEEARKDAQLDSEMSGSRAIYRVEEHEVEA